MTSESTYKYTIHKYISLAQNFSISTRLIAFHSEYKLYFKNEFMILLSSHQFPVILILLNGITLNPVTHHSFSPLIPIFDASPNIANIISYILNIFTWLHSCHNHPSQSLQTIYQNSLQTISSHVCTVPSSKLFSTMQLTQLFLNSGLLMLVPCLTPFSGSPLGFLQGNRKCVSNRDDLIQEIDYCHAWKLKEQKLR